MQPFFTVSVTMDGVKYRDETWDNVRFSLQKRGGGHEKTQGEYVDLIPGWSTDNEECFLLNGGWRYKEFVDMELFTYSEVLEMKKYLNCGNEGSRLSAVLFLDLPIREEPPYGVITMGRGRDIVEFFRRPDYGLSFHLIGRCDFEDGQAVKRVLPSELPPGEITF